MANLDLNRERILCQVSARVGVRIHGYTHVEVRAFSLDKTKPGPLWRIHGTIERQVQRGVRVPVFWSAIKGMGPRTPET